MKINSLKIKILLVCVLGILSIAFLSNEVYGIDSISVLDFEVQFSIENGEIIEMTLEKDLLELIIDFVSYDDGLMEIKIPRELLDAKSSDSTDDLFYVIVDGFETEYIELETNSNFRTIAIPFFGGDSKIEIIGSIIPEKTTIPDWVRNNAGWWSEGLIEDSDFVQGIQFLINEEIMRIPINYQGNTPSSNEIPDWIKNNAGWWANGLISDDDFVQGIQYLITRGIMVIKDA